MTLYFEDLAVDDEWTNGEYEVTEAEIIEFADQYDPQWFHTDPERATEQSMYGGLIASGWHTAAMSMRLLVESFLDEAATLGAKGVDKLRWHKPVQPGDGSRCGRRSKRKRPTTTVAAPFGSASKPPTRMTNSSFRWSGW